jgi:hypothetical protein
MQRGLRKAAAIAVGVGLVTSWIACVGSDPAPPVETVTDSGSGIDSGGSTIDAQGQDGSSQVVDATADASSVADADAGTEPDASDSGVDAGDCYGVCTVLATGQSNPTAIAVANGVVYWVNSITTNGSVQSCPVTGCPAAGPKTVASGQNNPVALVLDATNLYWANKDGNQVLFIPQNLGSPAALVANSYMTSPIGLALVPPNLHWMDDQGYAFNCALTAIGATPCSPSTTSGSAQANVRDFANIPNHGAYVYARDGVDAGTSDVDYAGYIVTTTGNVQGVSGDSAHAYYTIASNPGSVWQSNPPNQLAGELNRPWAITVDGADIYVTTYSDGTVVRIPAVGGAAQLMMKGLQHPTGIAFDTNNVYVTSEDGRVVKIGR